MTDVHTSQSQPESVAGEGEAKNSFGASKQETTKRETTPSAGWLRWGWRQLTSMRTALILLFLLALGSVPGSILPQEGTDPAQVQQYYTAHPELAPWLNRLDLFNVFAAPWFAAIYLLLFASLVGCVVPAYLPACRRGEDATAARTAEPRTPAALVVLLLRAVAGGGGRRCRRGARREAVPAAAVGRGRARA